MENHHFQWENPLLMAIFNSYFDITRVYHGFWPIPKMTQWPTSHGTALDDRPWGSRHNETPRNRNHVLEKSPVPWRYIFLVCVHTYICYSIYIYTYEYYIYILVIGIWKITVKGMGISLGDFCQWDRIPYINCSTSNPQSSDRLTRKKLRKQISDELSFP